ncbi:MAG: bifunctional nuclease family protein [Planctomycetota bacterium]|nr:MAG: bifunctional nuclease family protein [Planctomycetota bacterium]
MPEELQKIRIKKVLGPIQAGTALLLGNDEKTFVMTIGPYEGAAILRELNDEPPPRPMTHDLLANVLLGFDIRIKRIVISRIVNDTFCAVLVLEQQCVGEDGEWNGKRNEVHIDARPSDCLVLALKSGVDVYATQQVLDAVPDVSQAIQGPTPSPKKPSGPFGLKELDLSGLQDQFENFSLDDSEEDPEA